MVPVEFLSARRAPSLIQDLVLVVVLVLEESMAGR